MQRWMGIVLTVMVLTCTACRSQTSSVGKAGASQATKKGGTSRLAARVEGNSSFLYVEEPGNAGTHRLTKRASGWETDGVLSPDGNAIAYAVAEGPEAKSEVWVSRFDGSHAHLVSAPNQDAMLPAFLPDGKALLYVISRFNGHYSPIARPRRHKFDVFKVAIDADGPVAGTTPTDLTQQEFFDLLSLSVSPDGQSFLVSTTGYPIGSLLEEFDIAKPLQIKRIFQPHVSGEPSMGAQFGQAAYSPDGMDILFTAATEGSDGNYNYNVYKMSGVTGGELAQLSHRSGMIDQMSVDKDGAVMLSAAGHDYTLDPHTGELKEEPPLR